MKRKDKIKDVALNKSLDDIIRMKKDEMDALIKIFYSLKTEEEEKSETENKKQKQINKKHNS